MNPKEVFENAAGMNDRLQCALRQLGDQDRDRDWVHL